MKEKATILYSEKVTVEFDGFRAVNQMDFQLGQGELRFLIGPNGAGKTTMLDVICGKVKPASGKVVFGANVDITKKKEHQIANLGIGRKFQTPSIFSSLTVSENLELAMQKRRGVLTLLRSLTSKQEREQESQLMEMVGLKNRGCLRAGSLSHGEKQWLEIGMLLLQDPKVLLLDEPVAGMTDSETEKTGELLQRIVKERTVVVVEHDMEFVRRFASKVTVMHEGKLLKEGSMDEIQSDTRVAEVYLGKGRGADAVSSTA